MTSVSDGTPPGARGGSGDGRDEGRRVKGGRIDPGIRGHRRPWRGSAHERFRQAVGKGNRKQGQPNQGCKPQNREIPIPREASKADFRQARRINDPRAKGRREIGRQADSRKDEGGRCGDNLTIDPPAGRQTRDREGALCQAGRDEDREAAEPAKARRRQAGGQKRHQERTSEVQESGRRQDAPGYACPAETGSRTRREAGIFANAGGGKANHTVGCGEQDVTAHALAVAVGRTK